MSDNLSSAGNQQERLSSEEQRRWFLAGVIEGEGSVCVSFKTHPTTSSGIFVQAGLFVYQHRARRELLEMAMDIFQAGRIYPKPGNPDVLVYAVLSRAALAEKVVPFLRRYMQHSARRADYARFTEVIGLLEARAHWKPEGLARVVDIAYAMNFDGKQRRRSRRELLDRILRGHTLDAPGRGEEMVRSPRRRGELGGTETT